MVDRKYYGLPPEALPGEASLFLAWRSWEAPFAEGRRLAESNIRDSIPLFSEAIRRSAFFHPHYHFLESYLHLKRGMQRMRAGNAEGAGADFARAIRLDPTNQAAMEAAARLAKTEPPAAQTIYSKAVLKLEDWAPENPGESIPCGSLNSPSVHALAAAAEISGEDEDFSRAITLADETHQHYHRLAALPWLARAKAFAALDERELARNDCRRGFDLNRDCAELNALYEKLQ